MDCTATYSSLRSRILPGNSSACASVRLTPTVTNARVMTCSIGNIAAPPCCAINRWRRATLLSSRWQHGHRFNLEQHAVERQARHGNESASGLGPISERQRQLLAEHMQALLAVVDDEDGQLGDVGIARAGCRDGDAEIAQRLPHLQAEVRRQRAVLGL